VVNITDLYSLTVEFRDKLGSLLPSQLQPYAMVNGSRVEGPIAELYLEPGTYIVAVPYKIGGFEFAGYSSGVNTTATSITLTTSRRLTAYYKVPTHFENTTAYRIEALWWLKPFLDIFQQEDDMVTIYVEGFLKDYYGRGVANRIIEVRFEDPETGRYITKYARTDATGYFSTEPIDLVKGKKYRVHLIFEGDNVYTSAKTTLDIVAGQLPETRPPIPTQHVILAAMLAVAATAIAVAVKRVVHSIYAERPRFVAKRE